MLLETIRKALGKQNKVSKLALELLENQLIIVALGVRQASLVESIAIPYGSLESIMLSLRGASPIFNNIVAVYDQATAQSFFMNVGLFPMTMRDPAWTHYAMLYQSQPLMYATAPPKSVQDLIGFIGSYNSLNGNRPAVITLPPIDPPAYATLIPLAGLLLEYPLSYAPVMKSSDENDDDQEEPPSFLAHEPLDVYHVKLIPPPSLTSTHLEPMTLLQFSIPTSVYSTSAPHLHPDTLIPLIRARFAARLEKLLIAETTLAQISKRETLVTKQLKELAALWKNCSVEVEVESRVLDRVAL